MGGTGLGLAIATAGAPSAARPRLVAVMPAFNEADTIVAVLDDLYPRVDHLIVVDDGSTDETPHLLDTWAAGRPRVAVVHFPENRGLSAALRAGWDEVRDMLARGEVAADDVAFSIDADGQHEPSALDTLVTRLVEGDYAAVIGRRDLSYHGRYKRLGNTAMTTIGRICGGTHFEDIESGYRVFRIGPLLEAQEYYRGYRYSETVEVAVLLARLGYRVDNSVTVHVPVARTRTRLRDAVVDAVAMPLAWYRLACWRGRPAEERSPAGAAAALAAVVLVSALLALMLRRSFFLADDSAHSYAHVWYLAESLYTRHEWPWHVAQLENGRAVMFPYGIIPWLPAALVRPLLGDWAVTLAMVLAVVLWAVGLCYWRPVLRNPLLLGICLVNPYFWNGWTQFQLVPFWSYVFVLLGAGLWERGHTRRATALFALAIAIHPMMGMAALALYAGYQGVRARRVPLRLLGSLGIAAVIASPAIVLFVSTPLLRDTSRVLVVVSALGNMSRLTVLAFPAIIAEWPGLILRHQRLAFGGGAFLIVTVLLIEPPIGFWEHSQPRFADYLQAHPVVPGASYRVVTSTNREDGVVELMRAGAIISHEFFSESVHRRPFHDPAAYACFLSNRHVDTVLISGEYVRTHRPRSDEPELLPRLAAEGAVHMEYAGTDGTVAYAVQRSAVTNAAGHACAP